MAQDDKFGFGKMLKRLQDAKVNMPKQLAATGQLYFQRNFDKQQWDGVRWKPRKNITKKNSSGLDRGANGRIIGKALLVGSSGNLRGSLQKSIREYNWHRIVWGTDIPYAKYQNFGTDTIPAREFMGFSRELKEELRRKVKSTFDKVILNR